MKKIYLSVFFFFTFFTTYSQNKFKAIVLDKKSKDPLVAVHILFEDLQRGSITDIEGVLNIYDLPNGRQKGKIVAFGAYEEQKFQVTLPQKTPLIFYLSPKEKKKKKNNN